MIWPIDWVNTRRFHEKHNAQPGTVLQIGDAGLIVACKDNVALNIQVIYIEQGFYAGHQLRQFGLAAGAILGK